MSDGFNRLRTRRMGFSYLKGFSYIITADGSERALLSDAVDHLKGGLIGYALYKKYGGWPMYFNIL